jgi:ubiquinol-cytochrome c reductase cytochrome b subunit
MSLWGATVITSLITAIPFIGNTLAFVVWGGYSVGNATLNRFFSIHFILPFLTIGIILLHLLLLHIKGSTNTLGVVSSRDKIMFNPYFTIKDLFSFFIMSFFFFLIVCFYPNILGHPDNYIMANSLVTPPHIVPEWYFLPFYAILRAIPNKVGGVIAMLFAILILLFLPILDRSTLKGPNFKFFLQFFFILFVLNFIFLGFLGGSPAEELFICFSRISSFFYFLYFIVIIPLFTQLELRFLG